eukprot:TRINITY_DN1678_c0_g1_i4.p1 TRINITY_DN1678_c0_g1~~TRINITY_DN1678_c0_g1_i4.p1  ORF type:complete len:289 (-),score=59.89 TRINITY_DN1678_c0_g1_i4:144-1010(-)
MAVVLSFAGTWALVALCLVCATAAEVKTALRPRSVHNQTLADASAADGQRHHNFRGLHLRVSNGVGVPSKTSRNALGPTSPDEVGAATPTVQTPPAAPMALLAHRLRKQRVRADAEAANETANSDSGNPDAVVVLGQIGDEVRQNAANVGQLRSALKAEVALLRESVSLKRAARTRASRKAAERQVRQTELLVKEMGKMLEESRKAATDVARSALKQAEAARDVAQNLAGEASSDLQELTKQEAAATTPAATTALMSPAEVGTHLPAAPQATKAAEMAWDEEEVEDED